MVGWLVGRGRWKVVAWSVVLREPHSLSFIVPLVVIRRHSLYLQTIIEKSGYFSKRNILIATF